MLIIDVTRADEPTADMRFAFVGYRDYCNGAGRIVTHYFTGDKDKLSVFLQRMHVQRNYDTAEDVAGGLEVHPCLSSLHRCTASKALPHQRIWSRMLLIYACWLSPCVKCKKYMQAVLGLDWRLGSMPVVIHFADAPAHGLKYHNGSVEDHHPLGDPRGAREQIRDMWKLRVSR